MIDALKVSPLAALLNAAREMIEPHAHDLTEDAHSLAAGEVGDDAKSKINFVVGAMLPLEQLADDLKALVAAARAIQKA